MKTHPMHRRTFLKGSLASGLLLSGLSMTGMDLLRKKGSRMRLGLVTYQWGKHWTVDEIIANCQKSGVLGVELRSTHAHGVEPSLDKKARKEVKAKFRHSDVTLVGLGSAEEYDQTDPAELQQAIENTKAFIRLSHDVGGSGVKVRPNHLHENVPHDQTIEQIGKALNVVGAYGAEFGQQIRLEVHGRDTQNPEILKRIMDVAVHPNVAVCWNCNPTDLEGKGFQHNFDLLKDRFGKTLHIRELDRTDYPYDQLVTNLVDMDYNGWLLLECKTTDKDTVAAMTAQEALFNKMIRVRQS